MRYLSELLNRRNRMAAVLTCDDVILASEQGNNLNTNNVLEQFTSAMMSINSFIEAICNNLGLFLTKTTEQENEAIWEVFTVIAESDPELAELSEFSTSTSNQTLMSKIKRQYMESLGPLIVTLSPLSLDSLHMVRQEILKLVFTTPSSLLPTDKIILLSQLLDEIFGYGPLGPFRSIYGDIQLNLDGTFSANGKQLSVEFDNQEHRKEILGLFKVEKKHFADDGFVEYTQGDGTPKFRVPAKLVPEIEDSLTWFEKLEAFYAKTPRAKDNQLKLRGDFWPWL